MSGGAEKGAQAGPGVRLLGALGVAVFVVLVLARVGSQTTEDAPPSTDAQPFADPPAPSAAIALLGGLAAGDDVAGWKVVSITRPSEGEVKDAIAIWLKKDAKSFVVWIAAKGRIQHNPPAETATHAIFYGHLADAVETDTQPVIDAVKARVTIGETKTGGSVAP